MATIDVAPETQLNFNLAKANFYAAAKDGLGAEVIWLDGNKLPMLQLLKQEILPMAKQGLKLLDIDQADSDLFLGVIEERIKQQCNGAVWQRRYVAKHNADMTQLTLAYRERQQQGQPVHEWSV